VDTLLNFENATGSGGSDYIIGSTAANVLNGGAGNDFIDGGSGNDTIDAGAGNDIVVASSGTDSITLGAGTDRFRFSAADADTLLASWTAESVVITDFATTTDKLLAYGYRTGTTGAVAGTSGNYTEVLTAAASLTAYLTAADAALDATCKYYFGVVAGNGYLAYDDDGTGMTYVIKLTGVTDMAYGDIIAATTNDTVTGLLGVA
jgi:Ca2+-binding RTX toxin-like protein